MGNSSRSDDGWSETSYGGTRHQGARPDSAPGRRDADDWGTPSYSRRPDDATGGPLATRALPDVQAWQPAGPTSARERKATKAADRRAEQDRLRTQRSVERLQTRNGRADSAGRTAAPATPAVDERGMRWWAALLVLVVITVLGAVLDAVADIDGQTGFNYGIVIGSIVAVVVVRRSQLFPIVVAPPIVYSAAALVQLWIKSSTSSGRHGLINTVLDAVQNYLVYGFPALAGATAAVLIIAGIRLIARR